MEAMSSKFDEAQIYSLELLLSILLAESIALTSLTIIIHLKTHDGKHSLHPISSDLAKKALQERS